MVDNKEKEVSTEDSDIDYLNDIMSEDETSKSNEEYVIEDNSYEADISEDTRAAQEAPEAEEQQDVPPIAAKQDTERRPPARKNVPEDKTASQKAPEREKPAKAKQKIAANDKHTLDDAKKAERPKRIEPRKAGRQPIVSKTAPVVNPVRKTAKKRNELRKVKKVDNMAKKRTQKKAPKGTKLLWLWIVIAIIVIAGASYLVITLSKVKPTVNKTTSEIAATVNGEPIYAKDIEDQYNSLNPILQQTYSEETILNQTIDELLLIQEAKNENIKVSDSAINTELQNFMDQNSLTESDLNNLLEQQNLTLDNLKGLIERRLLIQDLLNETIFKNINITDDAVQQYYDQNLEQFKVPEQVTVRHILILTSDNVSDAQAKAKIEEIQSMLNDTNFCDLVKEYSQDPGSVDNCGEYTFGVGEMVQEFEDAAFNMTINETRIVKTVYGYHLIQKISETPAYTQSLADVRDQILSTLKDAAAQVNFDALIADLRAKATIVNYMYKTENQEDSNTSTVMEPSIDVSEPTQTQTSQNLDSFAQCLTEKGAKFYGASWCTHCNNQKELFGGSLQYVTYVECSDSTNPQAPQTEACIEANITGYPTWIIDGEKYQGEQTLENLAKLTGCELPQ